MPTTIAHTGITVRNLNDAVAFWVASSRPRAGTAFVHLSDQHGGTLEFIAAPAT